MGNSNENCYVTSMFSGGHAPSRDRQVRRSASGKDWRCKGI